MASIFSRLPRGTLMVRDWAATAFWIALRMRHTAKEENLWPRSGSNLSTASMRPTLPSWIRSSSGTPERRYPTATDTTSRRFLSMSVRRASRSPARAFLPSSISSRCVRRASREMRLRYADNGLSVEGSRAGAIIFGATGARLAED
jgi:hypothetical protein